MASAGLGLDGTHAARYGASEFLKDRHPDLSPAFPSGVIPEEIAVAFGRRHIPKLVDVIALPDGQLSPKELAQALRYLVKLLSNQESKSEAVAYGASPSLVHHLAHADADVRTLASQTLSSLAQLLLGRAAVVAAGGVPALTLLLRDASPHARAAASQCLAALSSGPDGAAALLECQSGVLHREVEMLEDAASTDDARLAGVLTLVHTTTSDKGIYQALDAHVPPTLLRLAGEPESHQEMRAACARALRNLAHHTYGKVQVLESGGIAVMSKFLQSNDETLQQHGERGA